MARKKLTINAPKAPPQREPETIKGEIAQLETLRRKSYGRPGLGDRVAEIDARLEECRAELAATNG